jgi:hypothetical protein
MPEYYVMQGAEVTASDISAAMVNEASRRYQAALAAGAGAQSILPVLGANKHYMMVNAARQGACAVMCSFAHECYPSKVPATGTHTTAREPMRISCERVTVCWAS